jgi:hypothetical protein
MSPSWPTITTAEKSRVWRPDASPSTHCGGRSSRPRLNRPRAGPKTSPEARIQEHPTERALSCLECSWRPYIGMPNGALPGPNHAGIERPARLLGGPHARRFISDHMQVESPVRVRRPGYRVPTHRRKERRDRGHFHQTGGRTSFAPDGGRVCQSLAERPAVDEPDFCIVHGGGSVEASTGGRCRAPMVATARQRSWRS